MLPLGFLAVLLTLFLLTVLDRAIYAIGSNLGKFLLQLAQVRGATAFRVQLRLHLGLKGPEWFATFC